MAKSEKRVQSGEFAIERPFVGDTAEQLQRIGALERDQRAPRVGLEGFKIMALGLHRSRAQCFGDGNVFDKRFERSGHHSTVIILSRT